MSFFTPSVKHCTVPCFFTVDSTLQAVHWTAQKTPLSYNEIKLSPSCGFSGLHAKKKKNQLLFSMHMCVLKMGVNPPPITWLHGHVLHLFTDMFDTSQVKYGIRLQPGSPTCLCTFLLYPSMLLVETSLPHWAFLHLLFPFTSLYSTLSCLPLIPIPSTPSSTPHLTAYPGRTLGDSATGGCGQSLPVHGSACSARPFLFNPLFVFIHLPWVGCKISSTFHFGRHSIWLRCSQKWSMGESFILRRVNKKRSKNTLNIL